ncbi:MAG: TRAP transporter substrate-binding protein DctP [Thermodesulfobacteriota bacterium]
MKKSRALILPLAVLLLFLLASCPSAFGKEPKYYWKTATLAPDGVGWARQMKSIVFPEIEKVTNGDLSIKVYWGGIMGDEEDVIKKMAIGQLSGAGLAAQGANMLCPEMQVVELPFLFNNYEEVDYVKEKMTATFDKLFAKHDYFLLAWVDQDFDQIYSSKYPMNNFEDFKKARFLTWYGTLEEDLLKSLGANPVPVNVPEVSASIRSGVADTAIGPGLWIVGAQMYSVVKYMNRVKIRYSPAVIVVTLPTFKALPEDYQKKYYELRGPLMGRFTKEVRKDNIKSVEAMLKYGIVEVKNSPEFLEELKARSIPIWDRMANKLYPKELLDEILGHLKQFRAANPGK